MTQESILIREKYALDHGLISMSAIRGAGGEHIVAHICDDGRADLGIAPCRGDRLDEGERGRGKRDDGVCVGFYGGGRAGPGPAANTSVIIRVPLGQRADIAGAGIAGTTETGGVRLTTYTI